ncbi:ParB-like protein [Vibrio sp. S11_S32]|uniref:ParB-like protein n=1 Tax=Vibrio sp. S11_S32 TaxID=2720225 RepID=UPI001EEDEB61|nr:ParB-like protein [Vibrio sp. S11_S32]
MMRSSHVNNGLKRIILTVAAFLLPVALVSAKQNIPHSEGDVVSVSLGDLHPTQALIGRDQVLYKLANYQKKPKNLFDDVCEANGQYSGLIDLDTLIVDNTIINRGEYEYKTSISNLYERI